MKAKQLKEALSEITAIKAETKTHLHYIGDHRGRIRQRLDKRLKHLDAIKSILHSAAPIPKSNTNGQNTK